MMRIDTEYHFKIKKELEDLKRLVSEFLDATEFVPYRAVDCNQDTVYTLIEKLADAIEEKNDR